MIVLLSPAKTLDYTKEFDVEPTAPAFLSDSAKLIKELKTKEPKDIASLMGLSDKLATLNFDRYQSWSAAKKMSADSQPALFVFQGDVYQGLEAHSLNKKDMEYAQKNLRILSGLYGILRPEDQIMPYRLEMGCDFKVTPAKKNLYLYWGDKIQKDIMNDLESQGSETIVNLASNEYARVAKLNKTGAHVIAPEFKDFHNGDYKMISFFAKKARGLMARFAIKNKIKNVEELKAFDSEGYFFNNKLSKGDKWVCTRDQR